MTTALLRPLPYYDNSAITTTPPLPQLHYYDHSPIMTTRLLQTLRYNDHLYYYNHYFLVQNGFQQ